LSGLCPDNARRKIKILSGRQADKVSYGQQPASSEANMSDPYLPLLLLFAFRGMITLIRTVEQLVIVCLALRDTAPEHRAPILRALRGKPTDDRPPISETLAMELLPLTDW
jgi:hypothetical protein